MGHTRPSAPVSRLISLFWGISPVTVKIAFADITPIRLAVFRFALGGAVILLWGWRSGRLAGFRVARDEARPLVIVGLILAVQVGCINFGTALTSAAHAAVILNSYAVHIVVLAHFLVPGDRLTPRRLGGIRPPPSCQRRCDSGSALRPADDRTAMGKRR